MSVFLLHRWLSVQHANIVCTGNVLRSNQTLTLWDSCDSGHIMVSYVDSFTELIFIEIE